MIEYYEESAKKYLELLDSTEKTDDTQDKLDSAKNKISELKELDLFRNPYAVAKRSFISLLCVARTP